MGGGDLAAEEGSEALVSDVVRRVGGGPNDAALGGWNAGGIDAKFDTGTFLNAPKTLDCDMEMGARVHQEAERYKPFS